MKRIASLMVLSLFVLGVACGGGTTAVVTTAGNSPTAVGGVMTTPVTTPAHPHQIPEYR